MDAMTADDLQGVYSEMLTAVPLCMGYPTMDKTGPDGVRDCKVDLYELARIAKVWLECGRSPALYCN